jgi:MFS family permease
VDGCYDADRALATFFSIAGMEAAEVTAVAQPTPPALGTPPRPSKAPAAAPLGLVMAFTFLNSLGSGMVSNGIFFMAKENFGFSKAENFALGMVYGLAYVPAALLVGPLTARISRAQGLMTTRGLLAAVMLGMASLCWLPWLTQRLAGGSIPPAWSIWVLMFVYSGLSGMLWPMVESYLSGGRNGVVLRSAIGRFNVCWSSSLVVAMLVLGPLAEKHAVQTLCGLGLVHVLSGIFIFGLPSAPAAHGHDDDHPPHPPVYSELLAIFKWLLPTAYLVLAALSPYMPIAANTMGLTAQQGVWLGAIWTAARVASFFITERWHGWHGQRWFPHVGAALLLGGFAVIVLAPPFLPKGLALPAFACGLLCFGTGMGAIYSATLYYTMAVGSAQVEAGGTFEALIGTGYTVGPLCGLLAVGAVKQGVVPEYGLEPTMLVLVGLLAAGALGMAVVNARKSPRNPDQPAPKH